MLRSFKAAVLYHKFVLLGTNDHVYSGSFGVIHPEIVLRPCKHWLKNIFGGCPKLAEPFSRPRRER